MMLKKWHHVMRIASTVIAFLEIVIRGRVIVKNRTLFEALGWQEVTSIGTLLWLE